MMEESINKRIKTLCEKYFGGNVSEMARTVGVNQPTLRDIIGVKQSKPSYETLKAIVTSPTITEDAAWLLIGDSTSDIASDMDNELLSPDHLQHKSSTIGRPFYDIDFICGFDELFNSHTTTPAYLIDYPPYNKDGVIWCNATGASMEPEINNGDVVVLQEVQDWDSYMTFGETYAIATRNNLRTIKKVRKGSDSDHLLLVPVNKDYDEQEIPKNMILKVFRVLAAMKKF